MQDLRRGYKATSKTHIHLIEEDPAKVSHRARVEVIEVKLSDIQDCYHKEQLELLVKDPSVVTIKAAAFENNDDSWSCHISWPELKHVIDEQASDRDVIYFCDVTRQKTGLLIEGTKINRSTAEAMFPGWVSKRYR